MTDKIVPIVALILSVACVSAAQIVAKMRLSFFGPMPIDGTVLSYGIGLLRDPAMWLSVCLTVAGALFYYLGLSRMPLNNAVFLTAMVYPAIALGSFLFLGERVSVPDLIGMALVLGGVITIVAG